MKLPYLCAALLALTATSITSAADPNWIWSTKDANTKAAAGNVYFRRSFTVEAPGKGTVEITADNRYELFINGRHVGAGTAWQTRTRYDIGPLLVPGRNLLAVWATNDGADPAGLVAKLTVEQQDKPALEIVSDAEWKVSSKQFGNWARFELDDSAWEPAAVLGVYGQTQPWGAAGAVQVPQDNALVNKPRAREKGFFDFRDSDRVVLLGSAFIERMQKHGYLETMITAALPDKNITFRNLGWSGDTVWGDARGVFGTRTDGFKRLLSDVNLCNPTVIIVCYGENEAYAGEEGVDEFRNGLGKLLDALEITGARLLLLSPRQHESLGYPLPDAKEYNASLKLYRDVIRETAQAREHAFIDLYDMATVSRSSLGPLTTNGIHLRPAGELHVARELLPQLGVPRSDVRIEIDVGKPSIDATNAQVFDFKHGEQGVSFSAVWRSAQFSTLNPEGLDNSVLAIKGLNPNKRYQLLIDGDHSNRHRHKGDAWGEDGFLAMKYERSELLQRLIAEKNALFFNRHRPQNETYLLLFRKHEQGNNAVEIPQFDPLIAEKEKEIAELKKPVVYKFELKVVE